MSTPGSAAYYDRSRRAVAGAAMRADVDSHAGLREAGVPPVTPPEAEVDALLMRPATLARVVGEGLTDRAGELPTDVRLRVRRARATPADRPRPAPGPRRF